MAARPSPQRNRLSLAVALVLALSLFFVLVIWMTRQLGDSASRIVGSFDSENSETQRGTAPPGGEPAPGPFKATVVSRPGTDTPIAPASAPGGAKGSVNAPAAPPP